MEQDRKIDDTKPRMNVVHISDSRRSDSGSTRLEF